MTTPATRPTCSESTSSCRAGSPATWLQSCKPAAMAIPRARCFSLGGRRPQSSFATAAASCLAGARAPWASST